MPLYQAYGLIIDSDWELPGFSAATGSPDVVVREGELPPSFASLHNGGDRIAGRFEGELRFVAEDGARVLFQPEPGAVSAVVQSYLAHFVVSVLLRQRGYLVLHAAALVRGPCVILFAGDSGWGKSTTAEYFLRHGFQLLAEDAAVIDLAGPQPVVVPGPVQIKLRPEAGAWLREDFNDLPRFHAGTDTRVRRDGFAYCSDPKQLTHVYVLEGQVAPRNKVVPLSPAEGVLQLIRHTRVGTGFTSPSYAATHLHQCERVVVESHVRRLERKKGLDALHDIFRVVEEDMAGVSCIGKTSAAELKEDFRL